MKLEDVSPLLKKPPLENIFENTPGKVGFN